MKVLVIEGFSTMKRCVAVALVVMVSSLLPACRSFGQHFESQTWRSGLGQFAAQPGQWVPVAAAAAVTPLLFAIDHSSSLESVEDHFFNTKTSYGDNLSLVLGFTPVLLGGAVGLTSGDSRYFEVTSEAIVLTAAETQLIKLVVDRQRPDGSSGGDSFPSGHTSFAFSGATLLARWWADEHEGSLLGYLLYLPAAYVGVSRLEGDRHFLSDITFGAALGMATAHFVWNAHFGDETHSGLFGRRVDAHLAPVVSEQGVGLGLSLSF